MVIKNRALCNIQNLKSPLSPLNFTISLRSNFWRGSNMHKRRLKYLFLSILCLALGSFFYVGTSSFISRFNNRKPNLKALSKSGILDKSSSLIPPNYSLVSPTQPLNSTNPISNNRYKETKLYYMPIK